MASTGFLRGTRIVTDCGESPVEALRPGMRVQGLLNGPQPIRAVEAQRRQRRGMDVRIRAGALGPFVPQVDLVFAADHAVLVAGHLVAAALLVNDLTILEEPAAADAVGIDLPGHDCVQIAGVWAEAGAPAGADAPCGPPRIVDAADPRLPAMRSQVTPLLSADDLSPGIGLHLLADGTRIEATHAFEGLWHAVVPEGTSSLRLRTRRTRPSMIDRSPDHRPLGLCVLGIVAETAARRIELALDDPALGEGFHAVEGAGDSLWRWTDGDALVPAALLGAAEGPVLLTIRGSHLPLNFIGPDPRLQDAPAGRRAREPATA